jgi:hypothetical protein
MMIADKTAMLEVKGIGTVYLTLTWDDDSNPVHTYDMNLALRSMERAQKRPITGMVAHHGGFLAMGTEHGEAAP